MPSVNTLTELVQRTFEDLPLMNAAQRVEALSKLRAKLTAEIGDQAKNWSGHTRHSLRLKEQETALLGLAARVEILEQPKPVLVFSIERHDIDSLMNALFEDPSPARIADWIATVTTIGV